MTRLPAIHGGSPAFPDGLPLVRPTFEDVSAVTKRLAAVLESGQLTNGRYVAELEETLQQRIGVPHVVAVSSCTAGLMLVYQGLGVRGEVLMPSHTFSASAHAAVWAGAAPRFADIEPTRATLDVTSVEERLAGASVVSATHLHGHPAEVEALERLTKDADVPLVLDSAHALGSARGGVPVGRFGNAEVFSLSPTKVAVAGEGGLVATRDDELAAHVRIGRNYGNPGDYNCAFPGLNARMSELHAVLALSSLESLEARITRRESLVRDFERGLADPLSVVHPAEGDRSTYKDLTLVLPPTVSAEWLQRALQAEGVDSRRYFWPPLHRQDSYTPAAHAHLPCTDAVALRLLTVPLLADHPDEVTTRLADLVMSLVLDAGSQTAAGE